VKKYWAAEEEPSAFAKKLNGKIDAWKEYVKRRGRDVMARRCYYAYYGYGTRDDGTSTWGLTPGGEAGQLMQQGANLVGQAVTLSLNALFRNKPVLQGIAKNSDADSLAQAQLATGLLEEYDRRLGLNETDMEAMRAAWLTSIGWTILDWDDSLGDDVGSDGVSIQKEGDITSENGTLFDVAYDCGAKDLRTLQWVAIRRKVHKYDLAAQFPEKYDEICNAGSTLTVDGDSFWSQLEPGIGVEKTEVDGDYIFLVDFRHIRTPALPEGRRTLIVGGDKVVFDGKFELGKELFAYPVVAEKDLTSPIGYTPVNDLIGAQGGFNLGLTALASIVNAHGLPNYWIPTGSNAKAADAVGSLQIISSNTKPEFVEPPPFPQILGEYMGLMKTIINQRLAINDVVSGEVPKGLPAQGIAAMQAQFFEFHGGLQSAYYRHVSDVRSGVIKLLQRFAKSPRVAMIAGSAGQFQLQQFQASDIDAIERITVQPTSPLSRTAAGKQAIADQLVNMGAADKYQYFEVLNTGRIDFLQDTEFSYQLKLQRDKELLRQGIGLAPKDEMGNYVEGAPGIRPLATDDFPRCYREYASVLDSPDARASGKIQAAVFEVLLEVQRLHRESDVYSQAMRGVAPPPPMMSGDQAGMMMGGMGVAAPPEQVTSDEAELRESPVAPMEGQVGDSPEIKLPSPPPNPITGEEAPPPL